MEELELIEETVAAVSQSVSADILALLLRFAFNTVVVWFIIHFLYYPKSKRADYYFTFTLIGISIFFLIYLLAGVKLKIGFAFGLFAIFSIIRYRTEQMPVREMTYLFALIAISVINAMAQSLNYIELVCTDAIFIAAIWMCENFYRMMKHVECKLIIYDKIDLIKPEKAEELKADVVARTGLSVTKIEVGAIDFLKDTVMLKVYYNSTDGSNSVNNKTKLRREDF